MALFSVEIGGSLALQTENLFPELPRVPGSLAPGSLSPKLPQTHLSGRRLPPVLPGGTRRQQAASHITCEVASEPGCLPTAFFAELESKMDILLRKASILVHQAVFCWRGLPENTQALLLPPGREPPQCSKVSGQKRYKLYPQSSRLFDRSHTPPGVGNAREHCLFLL